MFCVEQCCRRSPAKLGYLIGLSWGCRTKFRCFAMESAMGDIRGVARSEQLGQLANMNYD